MAHTAARLRLIITTNSPRCDKCTQPCALLLVAEGSVSSSVAGQCKSARHGKTMDEVKEAKLSGTDTFKETTGPEVVGTTERTHDR